MALQQTSDRLQVLLSFLLIMAINILVQTCLMVTTRIDMASDRADQWGHVTSILHNLTFALITMVVFGIAAHMTTQCDKTVRCVWFAFTSHMANELHEKPNMADDGYCVR